MYYAAPNTLIFVGAMEKDLSLLAWYVIDSTGDVQ